MSSRLSNVLKIDRVEVHAAIPEPADLRRINHYQMNRDGAIEPITWVYKLYVQHKPVLGSAMLELFAGNEQIRKYNGFPGGIYFTVSNPDLAQRLAGAPISFRREGEKDTHDAGARIPERQDTTLALRHDRALPRQVDLLKE